MQAERTAVVYRYRGFDRNGTAIGGVSKPGETSAALAERLFDKRARRVEISDTAGREVGGVGQDENGKRIWWGERG